MRHLLRLLHFRSNSSYTHLPTVRVVHLSSLSRSFELSQSKNAHQTTRQNQAETSSFASLLKDITEILGADIVTIDRTPSGISTSQETRVENAEASEEFESCTQGVCGNAELGLPHGQKDLQSGVLADFDVSPVVHEVAQIVRAENCVVSMEERLENAGLQFEPEIVEKVLKRCFKVPHLALRFFNWVKLRDGFCHTTQTYNTMLYIAGEAKDVELVEKLMKEMEENSCPKDMKTWTILISAYGRSKMIGKALLVIDKMRECGCEPDTVAYETVIRWLCVARKGDIAIEFYREMVEKEMVLGLSMYKVLLNCAADTENVAAVQSVADDMIRILEIPEHEVYGYLLKSFCVSGKIRAALELIRDLKNRQASLHREYFEILVKGLCRAGRIIDALEIVEIMKRKDTVDGKVYGIIINGYLRRDDVLKALDLFQSMKESGYLPAASTYTELMQRTFRLNMYQKGCELYNEMLEKGIEPDCLAMTAMVVGHVRQKRIAEAWKLFKNMGEKGIKPTWKSYSIFIKELCRVSMTEDIIKVLHEMQASEIVIGNGIFNWVISLMEKKGEIDKIEKVKQIQRNCSFHSQKVELPSGDASGEEKLHIELNHCQPGQGRQVVPPLKTHSEQEVREISSILWSSTDWDSIQEALNKSIIQFTPDLVIEILQKCAMHGNMALRFFSWVDKQAGYRHTTETYNMAIKISGQGKDFKHMRSLFFEMRRRRYLITPDTWTIMIMQYGRTGLTDIALRTFGEMKASGSNPTGSTYKFLIIVLCGRKHRKVDEAIKTFQEMIHAGYDPDKELLDIYLACLCETGKLSEARNCLDFLIKKVGFTVPLTYSMYIRALCRTRRLTEALSVVKEVESERFRLDQYTYGSLVHGLLQNGQLEEALAKMDSMKQMGINPTVHAYTSLIIHFFREKEMEKALETFNKMKQDDCKPTVVTYSAIICGYMNMGKLADAWNIFEAMKLTGPLPDFKTYSMLINCLCKAGKSVDALKLLSEMSDCGIVPSTVNFRTVFYGLNREGKRDLAQTVLQQKSALIHRRKLLI